MIKLQLTNSESMDVLVNLYSRLTTLNSGELSLYNKIATNFSKSAHFRNIIRNFIPNIDDETDLFFRKILITLIQSEIEERKNR
jgi:hypothetical protein